MSGPEISVHESDYVFRDRYPERASVYQLFDAASERARGELECRLDVRYGDLLRETFDLFPGEADAPLIVFVHGGYWQSLSKDRFNFVAAALAKHGFSVALPEYPLAPNATVSTIVDSCRASVPAIFRTLADGGRAPPSWIASGHSAGGHLAAMMATAPRGWPGSSVPPPAGCVPVSGIFDLLPLTQTSLNAALGLDEAEAKRLSPARMTLPACPLHAVVGADETPGFIEQSEAFVRHARAFTKEAELTKVTGRNHYTILAEMMEENSVIVGLLNSLARRL